MLYDFLKEVVSMGYSKTKTKEWIIEFLREEYGFYSYEAKHIWDGISSDLDWVRYLTSHEGDFEDCLKSFVECMEDDG